MKSSIHHIAKQLGSLGGKARSKKLTHSQKSQIALLGAEARKQSLVAAKRIAINFSYVASMAQLRGNKLKLKRIKVCQQPLPNISK